MIRVFLAVFGMFFLPFIAFAAYVFVRERGQVKSGELLKDAPVNWLAVIGTILAVATLGSLVSMEISEYENRQGDAAAVRTTGDRGS